MQKHEKVQSSNELGIKRIDPCWFPLLRLNLYLIHVQLVRALKVNDFGQFINICVSIMVVAEMSRLSGQYLASYSRECRLF